jgi:hypothetical protein
MTEVIGGYLQVGRNESHEVVINMDVMEVDVDGYCFLVFSPKQARELAATLCQQSDEAEQAEQTEKKELGPRTPNFDEHLPRVRAHRAMAEKINQEKCPVPVKGTPKECTTTKGLK